MLYYGIDHKVGAVGQLCPEVKKASFRLGFFEAHFWSNKTNVRQRKTVRFFSPQVAKKTMWFILTRLRAFVLFDRNGQSLGCLMKCVGAKCTKRCCRVQQRSAQRFSLCVSGQERRGFTPHS